MRKFCGLYTRKYTVIMLVACRDGDETDNRGAGRALATRHWARAMQRCRRWALAMQSRAVGRADIRDIVRPPYRDAVAVLAEAAVFSELEIELMSFKCRR